MTGSWLTTADHKRLGRMYIAASLLFLLVGALANLAIRAQDLSDASSLRIYDLHSVVTAILVVGPLFVGLGTYLVPLQIGAARLAFPRLQAFAFWAYVLGGLVLVASYTGAGSRVEGLSFGRFALAEGGDKAHTDLWIAALAVVTIAAVLAAANLLATVLTGRTEGLTLRRLPMFSWATMVSSAGTILAAPVFLAGLLLLYLDQHFGGRQFFAAGTVGTQVIWQHTLWLYGRPDVYLVAVPALGVGCDIVAKVAGRPLANTDVARGALAVLAFLGFAAWAAGTEVADAIVQPTYSPLTAAVLLPVGVLILLWLDTVRRAGRVKFEPSLLFVVGGILAVGGAALAAGVAAISAVEGSAWTTAQVDLSVIALPLTLGVGALHYWSPKLYGKATNMADAGLQLVLLLGGGIVIALCSYLAGWDGSLRGLSFDNDSLTMLSVGGSIVLLLGDLLIVRMAVAPLLRAAPAAAAADPADGLTLEWAAASPPPPHNFDTLPEVRSDTPVADLRPAEVGS